MNSCRESEVASIIIPEQAEGADPSPLRELSDSAINNVQGYIFQQIQSILNNGPGSYAGFRDYLINNFTNATENQVPELFDEWYWD